MYLLPTQQKLKSFEKITKSELIKIFDMFPPKTTSEFDEIPNKIIKYCKDELMDPLLNIINTSIDQSTVPQKMKIALIYPKHKKDDKQSLQNYRPISILPTISKYLEKAIFLQMIKFLEQTNSLSDSQHSFRSGKSINTALP